MSVHAKMTAIADAIRGKTGKTEEMTLDQMATEIAGIETGGGGNYTNEEILALVQRTGTEFVIPNGATQIGNGTFYKWIKLERVTIPNTVTLIGESVFAGCANLVLTELPDAVTRIRSSAFESNGGCTYLTRLPQSLQTIENYAFQYSEGLRITEIPALVKTIGNYAFRQCRGLTELTFKGTPTSITGNVFNNCTNLLTINVPWAEGAVANAPWGATAATINYNYTGG